MYCGHPLLDDLYAFNGMQYCLKHKDANQKLLRKKGLTRQALQITDGIRKVRRVRLNILRQGLEKRALTREKWTVASALRSVIDSRFPMSQKAMKLVAESLGFKEKSEDQVQPRNIVSKESFGDYRNFEEDFESE